MAVGKSAKDVVIGKDRNGYLEGPEGPEPALGSSGARCFVVIREIHYHADAAPAPAAEMPSDGPRRAH